MSIWSRILDILFPPDVACAFCNREALTDESCLCEDCRRDVIRFYSAPKIDYIDGYTAGLVYNDVVANGVKRLKYGGNKYVAGYLARFIELDPEWHIDAVVPVPLHSVRIKERGFNQSCLIAAELCKRYSLTLNDNLLVRVRDTKPQTGYDTELRMRNVKSAFRTISECRGINVLLVDDVRTTGATLHACAKALKKAGCCRVYAATACYADTRGG